MIIFLPYKLDQISRETLNASATQASERGTSLLLFCCCSCRRRITAALFVLFYSQSFASFVSLSASLLLLFLTHFQFVIVFLLTYYCVLQTFAFFFSSRLRLCLLLLGFFAIFSRFFEYILLSYCFIDNF